MALGRRKHPDRIVQDPRIMVGKPVVKGTRIPVDLVLENLAYRMDFEELFAMHPELTVDDIRACLLYASNLAAAKRRLPPRRNAAQAAGA